MKKYISKTKESHQVNSAVYWSGTIHFHILALEVKVEHLSITGHLICSKSESLTELRWVQGLVIGVFKGTWVLICWIFLPRGFDSKLNVATFVKEQFYWLLICKFLGWNFYETKNNLETRWLVSPERIKEGD